MSSDAENAEAVAIAASIVVHHSDLDRLCTTIIHADVAASRAGLSRVPLTIVDQSLDAAYRDRLQAEVGALDCQVIQLSILVSRDNRGYGAGQNLGLRAAEAHYFLILNPDVELDIAALEAGMAALAAHCDAVLAAPQAYTGEGRRDYLAKDHPSVRALLLRAFAPRWMQSWGHAELARYALHSLDNCVHPAPIPLASGACMLVRRDAYVDVGGFDEQFFMYFEDYDLSQRLSKYGQLLHVPDMRIVHHGGGAARKGITHISWFARSAIRYFFRWGWRWW